MNRRALMFSLCALMTACGGMEGSMEGSMEEASEIETVEQQLAQFDFEVTEDTASATNPNTSANFEMTFVAGRTYMIGTCGINESAHTGDTFLRLFDPNGLEVAENDDNCGDLGSRLSYTAAVTGTYTLRAGCYANTLCSGTVALSERRGNPLAFNVRNTNNASINTFNRQFYFNAGDVLRASTCDANATGASATGDTYLRVYQNTGASFALVATNDNAPNCGSAAEILFEVPVAGYYQVRVGCAANTACSGDLVVYSE
ncbi:hypothetical protein HMI51_14125 [Corallococcus coralloides]|nr:hypothetical protein [Corallococcus coralloides]